MGKCLFMRKGETHTKPYSGPMLGEVAVGSIIQLNESGSLVDYLVVHQGLPSSAYDESCNGTWLMRKSLSYVSKWHTTSDQGCSYEQDTTAIKPYMKNLIDIFTPEMQETIKQVTIPYGEYITSSSTSLHTGADGFSCKLFLLSAPEIGCIYQAGVADYDRIISDGSKLDYFESGKGTSALNKRIAYADKTTGDMTSGKAAPWWLRSTGSYAFRVFEDGTIFSRGSQAYNYGIRTTMILPSSMKLEQLNEIQ